jgi:hypothetical protein
MTQMQLTSPDPQPKIAPTYTPTQSDPSSSGDWPDVEYRMFSIGMNPVHGITLTAREVADANLRSAFADLEVSQEQYDTAEAIQGWSWDPTTPREVFALWSVNIERDLEVGRNPDNRYVSQRIQEAHRIRLNGLADPTSSDAVLAALRSIDDDVIRGHIDIPRDTVQMAAADLIAWVYGDFNPVEPNEQEQIAGCSEYIWIRDYLAANYQFYTPETLPGVLDRDPDGWLHGDKNPLDHDILSTFFHAFLEKTASFNYGIDDVDSLDSTLT